MYIFCIRIQIFFWVSVLVLYRNGPVQSNFAFKYNKNHYKKMLLSIDAQTFSILFQMSYVCVCVIQNFQQFKRTISNEIVLTKWALLGKLTNTHIVYMSYVNILIFLNQFGMYFYLSCVIHMCFTQFCRYVRYMCVYVQVF